MRPASAALFLVGFLCSSAVADSNGTWSNLGILSGPRTAVFDSQRHRMVVIRAGDEIQWLDLGQPQRWNRQSVGSGGRVARDRSAYVYDARHDRIVAFGGTRSNGTELFDDVWVLPLGDAFPTWAQWNVPGPGIDARAPAAAAYDSLGDRMLVFGGLRNDPVLGLVPASDVWALSLGASPAWTLLAPQAADPLPRLETHAVIDPLRHRLVIVAGRRQSGVQSDIWALTLDGTPTWSQLKPQSEFDYTPGQRWGASVVVDPDHDRIVLFGGRTNDTSHSAENNDRADTYAFPLAGGTWIQLPVSGPGARSRAAAIYDPGAGRMVITAGESGYFPIKPTIPSVPLSDTWTLSVRSTAAWNRMEPPVTFRPALPVFPSPFADPRNERVIAYYDSSLWRLDAQGEYSEVPMTPPVTLRPIGIDTTTSRLVAAWLGSNPAKFWEIDTETGGWTSTDIAGTIPSLYDHVHVGWDAVHRRMVVTATVHDAVFDTYYPAAYSAVLGPGATWQAYSVVGTQPAGNESFRVYDPLRDRFLVTGTGHPGDVYALTLGAQATWTVLGRLGYPYNGGTWAYDGSRDRVVQVGYGGFGAPPDGRQLVAEWPLSAPPAWTVLDPGGVSPVPVPSPRAAYDPVLDRLWVCTGVANELDYELSFGQPPKVALGCGPDVVWNTGGTVPVQWDVTNTSGTSLTIGYSASVTRDWPGYPLEGQILVGPGQTETITLQVPAPDTASAGSTTLTLAAYDPAAPFNAAYCARHLHDSTTPTLLSFAEGGVEGGAIALAWFGAADAGQIATLERKREGGEYAFLASVQGDATGRFRHRDEAPIRGALSRYRLSVGSRVSESGWFRVDAPAWPLSFIGTPRKSGGGLDVSFTLPGPGTARFLLVDVAGRRLLDRSVDALEAGAHAIRLTPDRILRAGVYFLRLEQGGAHARARVVVLP